MTNAELADRVKRELDRLPTGRSGAPGSREYAKMHLLGDPDKWSPSELEVMRRMGAWLDATATSGAAANAPIELTKP